MRCCEWRRVGRQIRDDVKGRSHSRGLESRILRGRVRRHNHWAEWRGDSATSSRQAIWRQKPLKFSPRVADTAGKPKSRWGPREPT
jgi:hypothetical protein